MGLEASYTHTIAQGKRKGGARAQRRKAGRSVALCKVTSSGQGGGTRPGRMEQLQSTAVSERRGGIALTLCVLAA